MSVNGLITAGRMVDPKSGQDGPGWIQIGDGVITALGWRSAPPAGVPIVLEAGDRVLAPALIDLGVDVGDGPRAHEESVPEAAASALAGGIGTLVAAPESAGGVTTPLAYEWLAARQSPARIEPMGGLVSDETGLSGPLLSFARLGARIASAGRTPIADTRAARRALLYARDAGLVVAMPALDPWLAVGAPAWSGAFADGLGLKGAPTIGEAIQIARDAQLAADTGVQLISTRVSTAAGVKAVRAAKAAGAPILATVTAAHLAFNEIDIGGYRVNMRLDPPLGAEADREALISGVRDGVIDIVVSGHTGVHPDDKAEAFPIAAPGGAGLEALLPVVLSLVRDYGVDLAHALRLVTSAPAQALGLPQGALSVGAPADLTLIDLHTPWKFRGAALASRTRVSPFEGRLLEGRAIVTMVAGTVVYELSARGSSDV